MATEIERQEMIIGSIEGQTSAIEDLHDTVQELLKWLQQPASSDMADLLKALIVKQDTAIEMLVKIGAMVKEHYVPV